VKLPQINADERRYKHSELTETIIGIFFYEIYNELGFSFLESVYEEAMTVVLKSRGIEFQRQVLVPVWFRGQKIGSYQADLAIGGVVLVELKACRILDPVHEVQLLHYLRSTEIEIGLLLNFGPKAQVRRLAFDNNRKGISVYQRSSAAKSS
jgi:GxxExxY protein